MPQVMKSGKLSGWLRQTGHTSGESPESQFPSAFRTMFCFQVSLDSVTSLLVLQPTRTEALRQPWHLRQT